MRRLWQTCAVAAGVVFALSAAAQTAISWNVTAAGNWTTGSNWSGGVAPANSITTNYADFNKSTGVTVTVDSSRSIAGLHFGSSSGNYTISQTGAGRTLTIGGYGIINDSANNQTVTGSGLTLTLGAAAATTFAVNSTGNLTISASGGLATTAASGLTLNGSNSGLGSISSVVSGAGKLTKNGSGTWVLSGTNTFSGGTVINAGTLKLSNTAALGTAARTLTLAGGTADLATDSTVNAYPTVVTASSTILSDKATANSAGITHTLGTLSIGTQTLSVASGGNVTANSAFGITFSTTTLSGNAGFDVANNGSGIGTLTLGALNEGGAARTITKTNAGTLVFGAAQSSTTAGSSLIVNGGIARVDNATALGSGNFSVTVNSTNPAGTAAFNLNAVNQTIGSLTFGGASSTANAINSVSTGAATLTLGGNVAYSSTNTGTATLSGNLALGSTRTFNIADSTNTTTELNVSAIVSGAGAGITKTGAGTLVLTGANTFTGATAVSQGTLIAGSNNALGANAHTNTISSGATLGVQNNIALNASETLSLSGAGAAGRSGAVDNISGTNTIAGPISVATDAQVGVTTGALTLSGNINLAAAATANTTLTFNPTGATTITASGMISDALNASFALNLAQIGNGTVTLSNGSNNYFGTTTVGTAGGTTTGMLNLGASNALSPNAGPLTIYSGTFNANNFNPTAVADVALGGGGAGSTAAVTTGTGSLTLNGNLTYDATNNPNGATISGNLLLAPAGAATTFTVGDSTAAANDLSVSAVVGDGGAGVGLTKAGAGTMVLSGANTYSGPTAIQNGTLGVSSLNSVAGGSASSSLGAPTTVADGTIALGSAATAGTLQYTGVGEATDRVVDLAGTTGGGTIDSSGSGAITFSSAFTATGAGAKTLTLTGSNLNSNTIAGAIVDNSGANTTSVVKSGAGMWTLSGANTYTGGTTFNAGTLNLNSTTALGGTAGAFTIAGGTLDNTSGGALTLANNNAQNWNGNFAFTGTNNLNLGTGAVTLGASRIVTANAGTLTAGGAVSGSGFNLTKAGNGTLALNGNIGTTTGSVIVNAGTLTLGGANTYTGGTTLNAGTLNVNSTTALGGTAGAFAINGGTLDNTSGGALTLANNNAQNWNGDFAFTGTNNLNLGTGAVTLGASRTVTVNAGALTVGGVISGSGLGLTKAGAGALTLGGANAQTGATTLSAGTLTVNSGAQLSGSTAGLVVNAGTLNLNNTAQTVASLNGSGGTINLASGHTLTVNDSGSDSFAGAFGSSGNLTKSGAGTLTLSGSSSGYTGNITVGGTGTLMASGNNSLGGAAGAITVNSGATLALDGGTLVAPMKITKTATLTLDGAGAAGSNGALVAAGASGTVSQFSGNLTLAGNTTVGAAANLLILGNDSTFANTLNLGANTLTIGTPNAATVVPVFQPNPAFILDAANVEIASKITGTGGLTKTGPGTLSILAGSSGGNTFTGDLTITGGKVVVASTPGQPSVASNNIYIGNSGSSGGGVNATLQAGQTSASAGANMIGTYNALTNASTTNLTIYADGKYAMNNGTNGFGNLTLKGGLIDGGTVGTHTALTVTGGISAIASPQTAVIQNGNLLMSASNFTFNVDTGGTGGIGLRIDDLVQNGVGYTAGSAGTSFVKTGTGTMVLSGANGSNTYQGITSVSQGILNIQSATALGQVGSFLGDTGNGTVVSSNAQLQLEKSTGLTFGIESLTLNGTGFSTDGALRNVSGNNTWQGYIYLGSDSRINADSGTTLTISNPTDINADILNGLSSGKNLTVGGSGNTTINGGIAGNINNVVKDGTGTLELAGSNGYAGATNVTQGAVKVTNSNGLSGTGVTVTSGAALQFAQATLPSTANISVGGTVATISGTGVSNGGAIQNLNGSNSYAGAITLGNAASIKADSGSTLTLSGGIDVSSPSHNALTIGGAGNITETAAIKNGGVTTNTAYSPNGGANTYTVVTGTTGSGGTLNKVDSGTLTLQGGATSTLDGITLTLGNITVTGTNTLVQAGPISSANASNVLTISSGAKVEGYYSSGTISAANTFTGLMAGAGTFQKDGAGVLVFNSSFTATNLTLLVTGGEIDFRNSAQITLGTLHIAGNTVLDFDSSTATLLSSTNVIIDSGVTVTVNNWASGTDFWLASGSFYSLNGVTPTNAVTNATGSNPESQITFANWTNLNTTWIQTPSPHGSYTNTEIRPVPEPAAYGALFFSGCLALLGWRRFSRRSVSRPA